MQNLHKSCKILWLHKESNLQWTNCCSPWLLCWNQWNFYLHRMKKCSNKTNEGIYPGYLHLFYSCWAFIAQWSQNVSNSKIHFSAIFVFLSHVSKMGNKDETELAKVSIILSSSSSLKFNFFQIMREKYIFVCFVWTGICAGLRGMSQGSSSFT